MSSVQDRKFNSILKRIPVETIFDVLKFLTYEQWFALQFSNWRLANIIKKNVHYLAFPKFNSISFYCYECFTPLRNITFDGIEAKIEDLDEKEKSDLTEALAKLNQMPLALFRNENPGKNFLYIYIRMTENAGRLLIELPIHPSTIKELALVRFWLLKLSQTHFKYLFANYGILNPEFLSALNPRTGPRKILFHANELEFYDSEVVILVDFAQFICARRIVLHKAPLLDESHRDNLFKFITGTENKLEFVHINSHGENENFSIFSIGAKQGEFCEFLIKSIMHMEAGLENVPEIIECNGRRGGWPNISGAKFTGTVDGPYGDETKYHYTFNNLWNEKVTFCLELIGREFESIRSFKITTKK